MVAGCIATSCPDVMGVPHSSLDAWTITVTGTGPSSSATLTFAPNPNAPAINDYAIAKPLGRFYNDGPSAALMTLDPGTHAWPRMRAARRSGS
jgi:hypothetical protein